MPINHISLNATSLPTLSAFYAAALRPLGYAHTLTLADGQVHAFSDSACGGGNADFWLAGPLAPSADGSDVRHGGQPDEKQPPPPDRAPTGPLHIAFSARSRRAVREFYHAAIAAGGKCNGPPGLRPHYFRYYYGAFVLDPDGRNVEAVCFAPGVWAEDWGVLGWSVVVALAGAGAAGLARWCGVV